MGVLDIPPISRHELGLTYASKSVETTKADATALVNYVGKDSLIRNVKDHGAKGDAIRQTSGGYISSGSATFVATGFTVADEGKFISVVGAGVAGAPLNTTIQTYQSPTQVILATIASTTASNQPYLYGTDDTAAIQALLDGVTNFSYSALFFPLGSYLTGQLHVKSNTQLIGAARGGWAYQFHDRCTRLLAKPGMSAGGLIVDYHGTNGGNVLIEDMMLDGAKAFHTNAITGVYMADNGISADSLWNFNRVYVESFSGDGIYLGVWRRANRLNEVHVLNCTLNGLRVEGTDNAIFQSVFAQCGLDGLLLNQGANHFINCDVFSNQGHGANIAALGRMNQFTNVFFDTNYKCGVYNNAKNLSLTQCRFTSNSQSSDGTYPDIDIVGGPSGNAIINPTFYTMPGTITVLPHSGIRAVGNNYANLVYVIGFSHDPTVTTWRSGSYVEASVGFLHKGFTLADGSKVATGGVNGTVFGGATDKLAFFGKAAGIALPTGTPAAATDVATTQALANDLRTKLLALGLIS